MKNRMKFKTNQSFLKVISQNLKKVQMKYQKLIKMKEIILNKNSNIYQA